VYPTSVCVDGSRTEGDGDGGGRGDGGSGGTGGSGGGIGIGGSSGGPDGKGLVGRGDLNRRGALDGIVGHAGDVNDGDGDDGGDVGGSGVGDGVSDGDDFGDGITTLPMADAELVKPSKLAAEMHSTVTAATRMQAQPTRRVHWKRLEELPGVIGPG